VVLKVPYCIIDYLFTRRTELGELAGMGSDAVIQRGNDSASFGESIGSKWCQLISVFRMAGKREHFTAQPHKLDTESVVPAHHLDDVSDICKADILDILAASFDVGRLVPVWTILGCMLWLGGVFERVSMLDDAGDSASP
jgi:hypothetical protein